MCQFLLMLGDVLSHLKSAGGNMRYDWIRYLVTRYEASDGPQTDMVAFIRSRFGRHVLTSPDAQKRRDFGCEPDQANNL